MSCLVEPEGKDETCLPQRCRHRVDRDSPHRQLRPAVGRGRRADHGDRAADPSRLRHRGVSRVVPGDLRGRARVAAGDVHRGAVALEQAPRTRPAGISTSANVRGCCWARPTSSRSTCCAAARGCPCSTPGRNLPTPCSSPAARRRRVQGLAGAFRHPLPAIPVPLDAPHPDLLVEFSRSWRPSTPARATISASITPSPSSRRWPTRNPPGWPNDSASCAAPPGSSAG